MEENKYLKRLTENETIMFIESRIKLNELFDSKQINETDAWWAIAKDAGLDVQPEQLANKWNNLLLMYKKIINTSKGIVTDEEEYTRDNWPYFDALHKYITSCHNDNPHPIALISNSGLTINCNSTQSLSSESSEYSNQHLFDVSGSSDIESSTSIPGPSRRHIDENSNDVDSQLSPVAKRKKETHDLHEELMKSALKTSKKLNKVLDGISIVMATVYNVLIDISSSSEDE